MNFFHKLPVQIRFNDVDLANHVNNAVYMEYCDLSRYDYFRTIIGDTDVFRGTGLVIASSTIDFFKPVFLHDKIHILSRVINLGNKSLVLLQHVVREGSDEPVSVCTTIMVCFNHATQSSEVIPDTWRKKIVEFEHGEIETGGR
jgi:acyl-CoA thioester hydrolase